MATISFNTRKIFLPIFGSRKYPLLPYKGGGEGEEEKLQGAGRGQFVLFLQGVFSTEPNILNFRVEARWGSLIKLHKER